MRHLIDIESHSLYFATPLRKNIEQYNHIILRLRWAFINFINIFSNFQSRLLMSIFIWCIYTCVLLLDIFQRRCLFQCWSGLQWPAFHGNKNRSYWWNNLGLRSTPFLQTKATKRNLLLSMKYDMIKPIVSSHQRVFYFIPRNMYASTLKYICLYLIFTLLSYFRYYV